MVEKIASIHKDEKFNKAAEEIAANYVKNRAHNLKKKKQKEELKAVRRKRAAQDGASTTDQVGSALPEFSLNTFNNILTI